MQTHHFLPSNPLVPICNSTKFTPSAYPFPTSVTFLSGRPSAITVAAHNHRTTTEPWLAQVAEEPSTATNAEVPPPEEGPIELPSSFPAIFATSDEPSPIQAATSLLLTGAISVFLFRSIRRRAKRAKEFKFRSSGAKKSLKEEALENLKVMAPTPINPKSPPSPAQAFLGALTAGAIAVILYKFTVTVGDSLNRQALSDNFSVRQITITIRTIINGVCYLATCVFGINALGLLLYSGQLAFNSFTGDSTTNTSKDEVKSQLSSSNASVQSPIDSSEPKIVDEDQTSDSTQ
ncbi:OLC1v1023150C1 [Oldenlandia corymbosa var. corymbosa]|uniref:OLC1v1023150C1 n=1 Tax=Oldenlandia corymbosa var. corymbosa TaxID=529605 RepID=A0AAV1BZB2_OLDCO|nr:OLC1v1023150C1 [Oldenlandia corymbosa var. corymbosa]